MGWSTAGIGLHRAPATSVQCPHCFSYARPSSWCYCICMHHSHIFLQIPSDSKNPTARSLKKMDYSLYHSEYVCLTTTYYYLQYKILLILLLLPQLLQPVSTGNLPLECEIWTIKSSAARASWIQVITYRLSPPSSVNHLSIDHLSSVIDHRPSSNSHWHWPHHWSMVGDSASNSNSIVV